MGPAATPTSAPWSLAHLLIAVLLAITIIAPALLNGLPLLFPDSVGYFNVGAAALDQIERLADVSGKAAQGAGKAVADRSGDTISTTRSVFYGLLFNGLFRIGGVWLLAVVQTGLVVVSLTLVLRRLVANPSAWLLGVVGVVAALAGVGVYAVAAMPDVFTGLTILGLAMLFSFPGIGWRERVFWIGVVLAAGLFHKAHLAVAAALLGLMLVALLVRKVSPRRLLGPAAALLVAYAGHAMAGISIRQITGKPPAEPAFLLGRTIEDGTAERYLRAHCPGSGLALCAHLDRFPMTIDEFMWSADPRTGLLKLVTAAERSLIADQAGTVVRGVMTEYPLEQARASTGNFFRQLIDVGATQFALGLPNPPGTAPALQPLLTRYRDSPAGRGTLPLDAISGVMLATYVLSFAALLAAAWSLRRAARWRDPRVALAAMLVAGLVANAAVCGVLVGVYDRYQGRIAWLMPLAAIALLAVVLDRRRGARLPASA